MKCINCKKQVAMDKNTDLVVCGFCGSDTPTGQEKRLRKELEQARNHLAYPKITVGRAFGYASSIYEFSTHNERVDTSHIESRLTKKFGAGAGAEKMSLSTISGREYRGAIDPRAGLMIYVVSGKNTKISPVNGQPWTEIFVVFRGSRGSTQDVGKVLAPDKGFWSGKDQKTKNPYGAGDDPDSGQNLDWRANLNYHLTPPPWAAGVMVHKGFCEIYCSMRQTVHSQVGRLLGQHPEAAVIVTGHSLGAGIAILCAHDLQSTGLCEPFCYPFCAPRTGNLQFARDFQAKIANEKGILWCELDGVSYHRAMIFTQWSDPVSWEGGGGGHGFKNEMSDESATGIADSGKFMKQGLYAMIKKTKSKTAI